jgi:Bacterial Ig-like domain (group 3)
MTLQNSFRRSQTRRRSGTATSAHALLRRLAFKPRIEHLEDRLTPSGGALSLTVNGVTTPVTTTFGQSVTLAGSATGLSNPNTNNGDTIQINDTTSSTTITSTTLTVAHTTSTTGTFTKSTPTINAGAYTLVAHDATDATVTDSTPTDSLTVNAANTSVAVTPASPSVATNQAIKFTATVTNSSATGEKPTGSVQFEINGVNFGSPVNLPAEAAGSSASVVSGSTSFTTASGAHSITAVYTNTDGNFQTGTSGSTNPFTAGQLTPTTKVTYTGTITVTTAFHPFPTSITVAPLFGDLATGTVISWGSGGGAVTLVTTAAASEGATTVSVTPATGGGEPVGAVSNPLAFVGGSSQYGQAGVVATATVSSGASHPTTGGVLWSDVLNTNVGSVTLSANAPARSTTINTAPLPGALQVGQQLRFVASIKTSAAAAAGATSLTVNPLTQALQAGMQFGFPNNVTATVTATASVGATTVSVSALSGAIASGQTATDTVNTVTITGNQVTITQVILRAQAASGATTLLVNAIPYALASGTQLNFNGTVVTLSAGAAAGALQLSVNATSAALANGSTNQIPAGGTTLTVNPLTDPVAVGERLVFGVNTATVAVAASAGATTVTVNATTAAIPGGTVSEPTEVVLNTTAAAVGAETLSVRALNQAFVPTTITGNTGVGTGTGTIVPGSTLTFGLTNVKLEDVYDGDTATVPTGATVLHVTTPEGDKNPAQGFGGLFTALPAGAQLKFGNVVVTLAAAAPAFTSTIHVNPTTGAIAPGAGNSANPGDTTLYIQPLSAAIGSGTLTNAANKGATSFVVNDIGTSNILVGTVASVDNHGNPLFMLGAQTTISPIGFTEVNGSGVATLPIDLLHSLVLPGVVTSYKNNGQVASAPLASNIEAQYVDGALNAAFGIPPGVDTDPNYTPGPTSAPGRLFISADPTTTTIAASPAPGQFGVTETLTATVKNASPADILPPVGTVTFLDSYTQGGITTNTTLGTVTLSSGLFVTSLTRSGTTATVTLNGQVTSTEYNIQGASPSGYDGTFAVSITGANTFTYTVPNTLTTPATGTIQAFALGISSATATFKTTTLAGGNPTAVGHTITAIYNGDNTAPFPLPTSFPFRGQWLTSQAKGTLQVGADVTTGTLSANPGQIAVTSAAALSGATSLSVNALPAAIASGSTLTFGTTTVTLSAAAAAGATTLHVNATSAAIPSGAFADYNDNAPFGSSVTFVDTLASAGGTPHGGTVVFKDGTTVLGTTSVNIRGTAVLVINSLSVPASPHTITATFNGNGNFKASTSNTLTYTITPGASTTTITGPNSASSTTTFTVTGFTYNSGTGLVSVTVTGTLGTSNVMTIAGVTTPANGFNGIFDVNITGSNTFTYTVATGLAAPSTTGITATEFNPTPITVGQAFNLTASVVGQPGFTPTGTVVFVVETNNRDAVAGSTPHVTPFTIGTATLAGGIAVLSVPATGAGSIASEATAAGDGDGADVYELEAFYSGDTNYAHAHSTAISNTGPVAAGAGQLAIRDTVGAGFLETSPVVFPPIVSTDGAHGGITVIGRVRDGAENGKSVVGAPGSPATITPQTGGVGGHLKIFLDGTQFATSKGAPSTVLVNSESGHFQVTKSGIVTAGQHVLVVDYLGDGLDGYLPAGSITITFTESAVGAANNSLASTKGSVVFSTAPKSSTESTASSSTTSSQTKPSNTNGLSVLGVDQLFSSTSGTTQNTPRTLAGALSHGHSGDDWLTGPF